MRDYFLLIIANKIQHNFRLYLELVVVDLDEPSDETKVQVFFINAKCSRVVGLYLTIQDATLSLFMWIEERLSGNGYCGLTGAVSIQVIDVSRVGNEQNRLRETTSEWAGAGFRFIETKLSLRSRATFHIELAVPWREWTGHVQQAIP